MERSDIRRAVLEASREWRNYSDTNPLTLEDRIIRRLEWYWDGKITRTAATTTTKE